MHGLSRTAESYIQSWEDWAKKNDYIAVAPLFDNENWNGARKYNLGNLLTSKNLKIRQSKWSFQIVEDLHKLAKSGFGLKKDYFDIFGHSAGGQFVHRFMFFMPKANVRLAIAANPGWYTLPDLNTDFPYGLNNEKFSYTKDDVTNWTKRNVFLLRGTDDLERTENLTQTPEADAQGKNRFERAGFMFEKIKAINANTNWRLIDVPKVVHDQKRMAVAAQMVLDLINKENKN
jgi:pimeloyl-ACP methyl ester carboxylesterase